MRDPNECPYDDAASCPVCSAHPEDASPSCPGWVSYESGTATFHDAHDGPCKATHRRRRPQGEPMTDLPEDYGTWDEFHQDMAARDPRAIAADERIEAEQGANPMTDPPDLCGPCARGKHLSCMGGCACPFSAEKAEKVAQQLRLYLGDRDAVEATNGVLTVLVSDA